MEEVVAGPIGVSGASKVERFLAAAGAAGMAVGAGVVSYFDPASAGFFPVCPLYSLTGFACPGCGLTRGFHALAHGDLATALDYNALLPFFALLIGSGFVSLLYFAARGRRMPVNLLHPKALYAFLFVLLIFGVIRNVPWYPFSILFP